MNKHFFETNRKNYLQKIENNSLSLFFSGRVYPKSADEDFEFEVNKNFYYLTGINQEKVVLALVKREEPETILFIEKNDPVLSKWVGRKLEKEEAAEISGVADVRYLDEFEYFLYELFNAHRSYKKKPEVLYLDLKRRRDFTTQEILFVRNFKKDYPDIAVKNAYDIVVGLRTIKSPEEIELIKASIETTKGGLETMLKVAKPGMYEYQLESYFDQYIKMNGQKTHAFKMICASGKNAAILHYVRNNTLMKEGDLVLFDLGTRTDFYVSDISRTIPVSGKFPERARAVYREVLEVNKKCIDFVKPGVTWPEFNDYARGLLAEAAERLGLIKDRSEIRKYYWHSIGHFIGLDTHDPGSYEIPFKPGMVLTVEPGLYIEEENIGVRIEDNVVVTEDGCVNLSAGIIKEIEDIENFMK